jgi:hypothetical protein
MFEEEPRPLKLQDLRHIPSLDTLFDDSLNRLLAYVLLSNAFPSTDRLKGVASESFFECWISFQRNFPDLPFDIRKGKVKSSRRRLPRFDARLSRRPRAYHYTLGTSLPT